MCETDFHVRVLRETSSRDFFGIWFEQSAAKSGVDAICCVPPFFYGQNDEAIVENFRPQILIEPTRIQCDENKIGFRPIVDIRRIVYQR